MTGASRGIGSEIVSAALAARDRVVAGVRQPVALRSDYVARAAQRIVQLDVFIPDQIEASVKPAVEEFGAIDVLVNNAGYGQIGIFEETTDRDAQRQFATNLFGAMDVTRAILPIMRRRRHGQIFDISSIAGLRGSAGAALYSASKFALEGFSEALSRELEPFGIHVCAIQPGHFRTDFLDKRSPRRPTVSLEDYQDFTQQSDAALSAQNHAQSGDSGKLAAMLVKLTRSAGVPHRLPVGADAFAIARNKFETGLQELERWRELSLSAAIDT